MYTRGRRLRFTAVSAMVVLALTGFSSTHGHRSRSHHGGDGGGCSSSRQDHDSSTPVSGGDATRRSRPTRASTPTPSSSGATARPQKDGTAVLVHCASPDDPYATVEVRNPNASESLFTVKITFKDGYGGTIVKTSDQTYVSAKGTATLRVAVAGTGRVDDIEHCEVNPKAAVDR